MDISCCCTPIQPCPACGYCPCCGRGGNRFAPYQPYPPYPQPIWVGGGTTGGYVEPSTTGMPLPLPSITVTC